MTSTRQDAAAIGSYPAHSAAIPARREAAGDYVLRFARDADDLDRIQKLRFEVFNLELGEGLAQSYSTCRDEDAFDRQCHHMLVEHRDGSIVGTYRMQTLAMTGERGFYSAGEFDLRRLGEAFLDRAVELGRACVSAHHRNSRVLYLLWRGLAAYMLHNDKRYFFGCCSLTSQDPADGTAMMEHLERSGKVSRRWRVTPQPGYECPAQTTTQPPPAVKVPQLMRLYLQYGARIAGPPAIDRIFGTIDFLTVLDLTRISERTRRMFLA